MADFLDHDRPFDATLRDPVFVAIFEMIPAAAFIVDAEGSIVDMNAAGSKAVGSDAGACRAALRRAVHPPHEDPTFMVRKIEALARYLAVMRAPLEGPVMRARVLSRRWKLTVRQAEVLALLARGLGNKDIASQLSCAEVTVEFHVTALLHKTERETRAALIARFWSETIFDV